MRYIFLSCIANILETLSFFLMLPRVVSLVQIILKCKDFCIIHKRTPKQLQHLKYSSHIKFPFFFQTFSFQMFGMPWQIRSSSSDTNNIDVEQRVSDAIKKLKLVLSKDEKTLKLILQEIENTEDHNELLPAFAKINNYFRYLLRVDPPKETYTAVRTAVQKLDTSIKFESHMKTALSLEDALYRYKRDVVETLSSHLRKSMEEDTRRTNLDLELFHCFFPKSTSTMMQGLEIKQGLSPVRQNSKRKRTRPDSPTMQYQSSGARSTDHDELRRKKVCYYFQIGKCDRGKTCRFKHLI